MNLDILAIGAHPDDIELAMSGSILVFVASGKKVGVVDLTRGELGTRGNPDLRAQEATVATQMLKLCARENLLLPDGNVADTQESRLAVIRMLRKYTPRLVFTHHPQDISGHPDHRACSQIVQHSAYMAGLAKIETGQQRHRPEALIFFNLPRRVFPSFIVDVSNVYDEARRAVAAYRSQFHDPRSREPDTRLSHPSFLRRIESVHRYYGSLIGANHGEAFWCERALRISDPTLHFTRGI